MNQHSRRCLHLSCRTKRLAPLHFTSLHCPTLADRSTLSSWQQELPCCWSALSIHTDCCDWFSATDFIVQEVTFVCNLLTLRLIHSFCLSFLLTASGASTSLSGLLACVPTQRHCYTSTFPHHGRLRSAVWRRLKWVSSPYEEPSERRRATHGAQSGCQQHSNFAPPTRNAKHRTAVENISLPRFSNSPLRYSL